MFVISLRYIKPLSEIDRLMDEHRKFLKGHYKSGAFLMSGKKEPRVGGIIIATAASKAEIEAIIKQDPFHREKAAEYEIIEFLPTMTASFLSQYISV